MLSALKILGHCESLLTPSRPSQLGEALSKPIAVENSVAGLDLS